MGSAEGHSYLLLVVEQCRAFVKEVRFCFLQDVPPKIREVHGDVVRSSSWPLHASGDSAMASHPR